MTDTEITALAREYAEECTNPSGFSKATYEEMVEERVENASYVLRWLCDRYCLVEKSKVEEEYHEANICRTHVERYGAQWGALTAKMAILERLFPDLGKEVEG